VRVVSVAGGDPHVDDNRNAIVREFLAGDCTDLLFIDSDVGGTLPMSSPF